MTPAEMLNGARRSAGLSQRELARRTGVAQSAIARIERGQQVPRSDTLDRLLRACGWQLEMAPLSTTGVDRSQIQEWLGFSPAERLRRAEGYGQFVGELRAAARPRPA